MVPNLGGCSINFIMKLQKLLQFGPLMATMILNYEAKLTLSVRDTKRRKSMKYSSVILLKAHYALSQQIFPSKDKLLVSEVDN